MVRAVEHNAAQGRLVSRQQDPAALSSLFSRLPKGHRPYATAWPAAGDVCPDEVAAQGTSFAKSGVVV
eukprot:scaffold4882_cov70-Phaeocystis_antarctica.AAC.10